MSNLKKSLKKIQKENRFELTNTFQNQTNIEEKITLKTEDPCKIIYDFFVLTEEIATTSSSSKNSPQNNIQQLEENKSIDNFKKYFIFFLILFNINNK